MPGRGNTGILSYDPSQSERHRTAPNKMQLVHFSDGQLICCRIDASRSWYCEASLNLMTGENLHQH
jgi:hypothetical protein